MSTLVESPVLAADCDVYAARRYQLSARVVVTAACRPGIVDEPIAGSEYLRREIPWRVRPSTQLSWPSRNMPNSDQAVRLLLTVVR